MLTAPQIYGDMELERDVFVNPKQRHCDDEKRRHA